MIDYEADVQYIARTYKDYAINLLPGDILDLHITKEYDQELSEVSPTFVTLDYTEQVSNVVHGLFTPTYTWNRIESVSDFVAKEDLSDTSRQNIQNMQWVLRFSETEFGEYNHSVMDYSWGTEVSEVTILRLKFETNGVIYNLGVVDTKQTGSGIPDNIQTADQAWKIILALVLLVLVVNILSPFLPVIISGIKTILKAIWNAIKWVITLPFRIFKR